MAWDGSNRREELPANWASLRRKSLGRDAYLCQFEKSNGKLCYDRATDIDHIIPGSLGGTDDLDNLQSLCGFHHGKKTSKEGQAAKIALFEKRKKDKHYGPVHPLDRYKTGNKKQDIKKANVSKVTPSKPLIKYIGKTWIVDKENGGFILPKYSLGYGIIEWIEENCQFHNEPAKLTPEQKRFILWSYEVNPNAVPNEQGQVDHFVNRVIILQRIKGWGKDPLIAVLMAAEICGPVRFSHFDADGLVVGKPEPSPSIPLFAGSFEQVKRNTMGLFENILKPTSKKKYKFIANKESVTALGRNDCWMVPGRDNTDQYEGARFSCGVLMEPHHMSHEEGHNKYSTIRKGIAKTNGIMFIITNSYDASEGSFAQTLRENYDDAIQNKIPHNVHKTYYDSIEGPDWLKELDDEIITKVVRYVAGDAHWLQIGSILSFFNDPNTKTEDALRYYFNAVGVIGTEAWVDIDDWDGSTVDLEIPISPEDPIVLFGDFSLNDDNTVIVAVRLSDGYTFIPEDALWSRPRKTTADWKHWQVPRQAVNDKVDLIFSKYNVVAFWADPSHAKDAMEGSEGQQYWIPLMHEWHQKYKDRLQLWAQPSKHAIIWDMASPARIEEFTHAAELFALQVGEWNIPHARDTRLRDHIRNARRYTNKYGQSIWKGSHRSNKKIDAAVCAVGANMLRNRMNNKVSDTYEEDLAFMEYVQRVTQ